jgi:hypothetical protein
MESNKNNHEAVAAAIPTKNSRKERYKGGLE